jgi:hypothetical protein
MMGSGHNKEITTPTSSEISERRRLAAIGIKAGKSKRLVARELGVTATTISRYLEVLGITAPKKPIATIRKPAVVWKASSPATSDSKVAAQNPTKRIKLRPRPVFTRSVVPEPLKPGPPKSLSPAKPLRPEQLRQQRLEEMLQLVGSWFVERDPDYTRATNVLDKARNFLAARLDLCIQGVPESPMSAEQLRDHTRPEEMDPVVPQSLSRREEACAKWLANWLAAWAPKDKQLRKDLLDQTRAALPARLR